MDMVIRRSQMIELSGYGMEGREGKGRECNKVG